MKRTLILAVGCGLFASVAFAQTPRRRTIGAGLREQGRGQRHVQYAVEPDRARQAGGRRIQTVAEKMVQDHQKTSSKLKALVEGGKVKAELPRH